MVLEALIMKMSVAKLFAVAVAATAVTTLVVLRKDHIDEWFGRRRGAMRVDPDLIGFLRRIQQNRHDGLQRYQWGIVDMVSEQIVASKLVDVKAIDPAIERELSCTDTTVWSSF